METGAAPPPRVESDCGSVRATSRSSRPRIRRLCRFARPRGNPILRRRRDAPNIAGAFKLYRDAVGRVGGGVELLYPFHPRSRGESRGAIRALPHVQDQDCARRNLMFHLVGTAVTTNGQRYNFLPKRCREASTPCTASGMAFSMRELRRFCAYATGLDDTEPSHFPIPPVGKGRCEFLLRFRRTMVIVSQRARGFNWPWSQMPLVLSPAPLTLSKWDKRRGRLHGEPRRSCPLFCSKEMFPDERPRKGMARTPSQMREGLLWHSHSWLCGFVDRRKSHVCVKA